eukprot:COSAG01_NODE_61719_length_288_cov_0.814815_1_plen_69_part_10
MDLAWRGTKVLLSLWTLSSYVCDGFADVSKKKTNGRPCPHQLTRSPCPQLTKRLALPDLLRSAPCSAQR